VDTRVLTGSTMQMQTAVGNESVSQQRPQGRRRAHDPVDAPSTDPATFADLAVMWRSVSTAHGVLEQRRQRWDNTDADDRLAEQLSIVPMLHDRASVTEAEARELAYLLTLYAEPTADATREDVAEAVDAAVRAMAARRGATGRSV
jgi:hypothetical protein